MKKIKTTTPPKKLKAYKVEQCLLPLLFSPSQYSETSTTIDLYDAMPKFCRHKRLSRVDGKFLDPLKRQFTFKNAAYEVIIAPARIEDAKVGFKDHFPGTMEELIEDALRKMALEGNNVCFLDGKFSVLFSLYELQKELTKTGHTYSISQLKRGLLILAGTHLTIKSVDGKTTISSGTMFETVGLSDKSAWRKRGRPRSDSKCFVRFNQLVDTHLHDNKFRPLDYLTCMGYSKPLARYLHKRLSHVYTQASSLKPYHFLASTLLQDSGSTMYKALRYNLREIRNALDELINPKNSTVPMRPIITNYIEDPVKNGRAIIDVKFTLFPSSAFVSDSKEINSRMKMKKNRLK